MSQFSQVARFCQFVPVRSDVVENTPYSRLPRAGTLRDFDNFVFGIIHKFVNNSLKVSCIVPTLVCMENREKNLSSGVFNLTILTLLTEI